jgi:hypothetical protein
MSKTIGKCIYCSSTKNLSNEHVYPEGLGGGNLTLLKKASCEDCRKITSSFELDVLRDMFGGYRYTKKYPSKNNYKGYPKEIKLERIDGKTEMVKTEDGNFPAPLLVFGRPYCELNLFKIFLEPDLRGIKYLHPNGNPHVINKGQVQRDKLKFLSYHRMLAKITWGMAVLEYGLDNVNKEPLVPFILGKRIKGGHRFFIGCNPKPEVEVEFAHPIYHEVKEGSVYKFSFLLMEQGPVYEVFFYSSSKLRDLFYPFIYSTVFPFIERFMSRMRKSYLKIKFRGQGDGLPDWYKITPK